MFGVAVVAVESSGHYVVSADAAGCVLVWDLRHSALQPSGAHGEGEGSELSELRVDSLASERQAGAQGHASGHARMRQGSPHRWPAVMRLPGASREEMAAERANAGARCAFAVPLAHQAGGGMCVTLCVGHDVTMAASAGRDGSVCVMLGAHPTPLATPHAAPGCASPSSASPSDAANLRHPASASFQLPPSPPAPAGAATDDRAGRGQTEWVYAMADAGGAGSGKRYAALSIALQRDPVHLAWWLAVGEAAGGVTVYLVSMRPRAQPHRERQGQGVHPRAHSPQGDTDQRAPGHVPHTHGPETETETEAGRSPLLRSSALQKEHVECKIVWQRRGLKSSSGLPRPSVLCLSIYAGTLIMGNGRGDVTIRALHNGRRISSFRAHPHSSAAVTALAVRRASILTGTLVPRHHHTYVSHSVAHCATLTPLSTIGCI